MPPRLPWSASAWTEFFAAVVVWQLRGESEDRERRAVRLIGITFFALAAYLAVESIRDLISQARPGQSPTGIAVTSAALLVMPSLAVAEHRTGKALGARTLIAAAESAFCAFTSAAAILALGLKVGHSRREQFAGTSRGSNA